MPQEPYIHNPEVCRVVMEHLRDHAVFQVDWRGYFSLWSIGVFRLFGYTEIEFIGQPVTMILPPETDGNEFPLTTWTPKLEATLNVAEASDESIEIQQWYRRKNGTRFWATSRTIPICNDAGEVESIFQIVRDDNIRHGLEERLRQQNTELKSLARSKDDFLATISHELRTPLQSILGWLHILNQDGVDTETKQRALGIIEHSAKAQAQLIEDLLDVSRIITGKLRLNLTTVNLNEPIQRAIEVVKPTALEKSVALQFRSSGPYLVIADSARVEQVILNLLSNALKFTSEGGTVTIEIVQQEGNTNVVVRDTGQGIDPQFLPYVFDRFRQGDSSDTRQHLGLGIGLALVHQLMELQGGSVTAESEGQNKGAVFTLTFPASDL